MEIQRHLEVVIDPEDQVKELGEVVVRKLVLCDPPEAGWQFDNVIELPVKTNPPDLAA